MRQALLILALTLPAAAQWQLQDAHTTADLRGIYSLGGGVAWASGTNGTVLRTEDAGFVWQLCAVPPGAAKLDFRGIQAFDNNTAIVMSSGKGDLSRLYKTTDGCQTWKLVFTNPDPEGFWDGLQFSSDRRVGYVIGDPVNGRFPEFLSYHHGDDWIALAGHGAGVASANGGEALFAGSNSSMILIRESPLFVTGGKTSRSLKVHAKDDPRTSRDFVGGTIPVSTGESAGAFSVAAKLGPDSVAAADTAKLVDRPAHRGDLLIVVGGDYRKPDESEGTSALSEDGGDHWTPSRTLPHGYRSSVAYDPTHNTWITVGPNGTDVSSDDGRNWRALKPGPLDPPDADQHWNALSLPYVAGPHGRIGRLRDNALTP